MTVTSVSESCTGPKEGGGGHHAGTLRQNFSWTLLGNTVFAASNWAVLMVLAKLGTKEMVGGYALALALTQPIVIFSQLQLRGVQATDALRAFRFAHYLMLRLCTTAMALVFMVALVFLNGYSAETRALILLVALVGCLDSTSDVFYGRLQQQEQMDWIALSMLVKGPVSLVLLALGVLYGGGLLAGVAGMIVARALVLGLLDLRSFKRWSRDTAMSTDGVTTKPQNEMKWTRQEWATVLKLAWLALPMGIVLMVNAYCITVPRYRVEEVLGKGQLGIFAANVSLLAAGRLVIVALGQAASPRLARFYANGDLAAFRRLMTKLLTLGLLLGLGIVVGGSLAGRHVIAMVYRPEYSAEKAMIYWLLGAEAFSYLVIFLGAGLTAARHFRLQLPLSLVGLVVAYSCSWLWIPEYGLAGAGAACFATSLATFVVYAAPFIVVATKPSKELAFTTARSEGHEAREIESSLTRHG